MTRMLIPFGLLVALLIGFTALDKPQPPADLSFVNRGEVMTIDPQRMSWLQDFRIGDAIWEGLVAYDNEDFSILPGVAERWEVSPDGLTYTFHLRGNAKWSNGDRVTAEDFIYSWGRAMIPDTAADYQAMFTKIRGGQAIFDFRTKQLEEYAARVAGYATREERRGEAERMKGELEARFREVVGLEAPDARTLIVQLEVPTPYMLDLFAFGSFAPVHRPTVEAFVSLDPETGMIVQEHGWTKPEHLVCNGPYVLTVWRYKRDMRLERNAQYWNPGAVVSDSVTSLSIEDANTAVLAFETGTLDWLSDVQAPYRADMLAQARGYRQRMASRIAELEAEGKDYDEVMATIQREDPPRKGERNDIHAFPAFGTLFYNFNCQEKLNSGAPNPFHHAGVRRAFALAVDKQAIVDRVTRMGQPVADVFIPPGSILGFNGSLGIHHDAEKAVKELEGAGWSDRNGDGVPENAAGEPFPTVEILFPSGAEHRPIAEALSNMWERVLGVRTSLQEQETKVQRENMKQKNYMIARANWFGDYGDPTTFLDVNRTGDGNNDRGYSNAAFDELLRTAEREVDPDKRMRILEEADRIIVEQDLPFIPLYHQVTLYMYDPTKLEGLSQHPRLTQFLSELRVNR